MLCFSTAQDQLKQWWWYFERIEHKSIYHAPDYIKTLEGVFGTEGELFIWGDEKNFIYYPYLKRKLSALPFAGQMKPLHLTNQTDMANPDLDSCWDIGSSWYYGGPLASSKEAAILFPGFLEAFKDYARQTGIVSEFIRFDANLKNHELFPPEAVTYNRETVYVDLTQGEEALWAGFSSANQRALRKALKTEYRVHEVKAQDTEKWTTFHEIYQQEMKRKNAPAHLDFPLSFILRVKDGIPANSQLLTVEKEDKVCGGFIIVYDREYAFHFLSASHPEYWQDRINNLLFYHALLWAQKKGCRIFDFMGGRPGVFRFKTNFSPARGTFYTYQYIHHPDIYKELTVEFKKYYGIKEDTRLSYFPAYRDPGYGDLR